MPDEAYAPKLQRPATLDHLRKKKPLERTVTIILEDEPVEALDAARTALQAAKTDSERKKCDKVFEETKKAVEAVTVEMVFRSIGRKAYDAILDAHQPTPEQEADAKENGMALGYNPETFPPALVAACAVEPKMTLDEVMEIWDEWNGNEVSSLFYAALAANTGRRVADLGKGFGETSL